MIRVGDGRFSAMVWPARWRRQGGRPVPHSRRPEGGPVRLDAQEMSVARPGIGLVPLRPPKTDQRAGFGFPSLSAT
jgi:hypothetical protein